MNKGLKILVSILGGVNFIFSVFLPTLVAILIVSTGRLSPTNQFIILLIGILSTLYRAMTQVIPILKE